VDVAGAAMPMQKIETVDMPRSEALASSQTTLGELRTTMHDDFRNKLIWGDNKLVMASLLKDFRGKIDLIQSLKWEDRLGLIDLDLICVS
jgi:adenine-specific DNA-methyltransferase